MAKHKRYSRKRSQRRNRRVSRKMKGGVDTPIGSPDNSLHASELELSGQSQNLAQTQSDSTMLSDNGFVNPDYSGSTTINTNDWSIGQEGLPNFGQPVQELPDFGDISTIGSSDDELSVLDDSGLNLSSVSTNTTLPEDSFGGKRRTNKRKTLAKQNKRKSKKSRKTRKNRKKRQYGGIPMTTTEEFSPVSYLDSMEESQTKMVTPFKQ